MSVQVLRHYMKAEPGLEEQDVPQEVHEAFVPAGA